MINLPWLDTNDLAFPPTSEALAEPNGLLAVGGDLTPARILHAYQLGIFPWYSEDQPILWWSPNPRLVIKPNLIHISKSLRKLLKKNNFRVTADQQFSAVLKACAEPRDIDNPGTWITPEMAQAYQDLHKLGHAHSIEVWEHEMLVGGLYGLSLGQVFFGESMFSIADNASKVALVYLCSQLQQWGFQLIDCQVESDHLISLGAANIPRKEFEQYLQKYTNIVSNNTNKASAGTPQNPGKWELTWQYQP